MSFTDSDTEEPQIPLDPLKTTRKNSCARRRIQPQKSPGNSPGFRARPRRGRLQKELGTPKNREKRGINPMETLEKKENGISQKEKRGKRGNPQVENLEKRGNSKMDALEKTENPKMENLEKKGKEKPQNTLEKKERRGPRWEKKERGTPQSGILEEKRNWEFCEIEERDPLRAVEEEEEEVEEEMSFELPPLPQGAPGESGGVSAL